MKLVLCRPLFVFHVYRRVPDQFLQFLAIGLAEELNAVLEVRRVTRGESIRICGMSLMTPTGSLMATGSNGSSTINILPINYRDIPAVVSIGLHGQELLMTCRTCRVVQEIRTPAIMVVAALNPFTTNPKEIAKVLSEPLN